MSCEDFHHTGMPYQCVLAQARQLTCATFSQLPVVTELQVATDGVQSTPEINDQVDIQGVDDFTIFIFKFTAPEEFSGGGQTETYP